MDSIPPSQGRSKKHHGRRKKRHHKAKPKEMTPEEVLDLSPWAKWILYKSECVCVCVCGKVWA